MKNRLVAKLILLACLLPSVVYAEVAGVITHLGGVLHATNAEGVQKVLNVGSEVQVGDTLRTELNTYTRLKFNDGGEIVLRPETVFKVEAYTYNAAEKGQDNFMMSLAKGGMRSVTGLLGKRNPDKYKVKTGAATIGIRGTHFGALLCNNDCGNLQTVTGKAPPNGLHTDTVQGTTVITNAAGSIEVPAGSFSYTANMNTAPVIVPPSQGIQVTMPTSISSNKSKGGGIGSDKGNACTVN